MGMLVEGKWEKGDFPRDKEGRFVRDKTRFNDWIEAPERDRYHLYVAWACPWAHRTIIVRKLRQLDGVIGMSVVDPVMGDDGWFFSDHPGSIPDSVNSAKYLREIYLLADPAYTGRVTTPMLWDKKKRTIV